jgi:hypothetical protein
MERQFKDQLPYVLNLPDKHVRRVFTLSSKLLSKILRALAPLLLLPYSLGLQALSAKTTDIIQGTAAYLTFDSGKTKVTTTEDLLSIRLSRMVLKSHHRTIPQPPRAQSPYLMQEILLLILT